MAALEKRVAFPFAKTSFIERVWNLEQKALKPRKGWVAVLLTLLTPGLGHCYLGFLRKGLLFYVFYCGIWFLSVVTWGYVFPSIYSLGVYILVLLGYTCFVAFSAYQHTKNVPPQASFRWYSRWYGLLGIFIFLDLVPHTMVDLSIKYFIQSFRLPMKSMASTLLEGDHIMVQKALYGLKVPFQDRFFVKFGEPERGDIIVFKYPEDETKDYLKRVVGLPGETVEIRNKQVLINGKELNEPYKKHLDEITYPAGSPNHRDNFGPFPVPEGEYFVLGDNRERSSDSRFWGTVSEEKIMGKLKMIYWSYGSDCEPDDSCPRVRWDRIGKQF